MICMAEGGQRKGLLSRSSDVMPDAVKIGWLNLLPALYPMKIRRCHSGKKTSPKIFSIMFSIWAGSCYWKAGFRQICRLL